MAVEVRPPAPSPLDELIRAIADQKERPRPWVDATTYPWGDDDFSERFVRRANYQAMFGMKDTGEEAEDIAAMIEAQPKARLLDLCSGNGRHAVALALRGFRVTGIDVGPGPIMLSRETAKNLALPVDFRQLDVCKISFEDCYDAAYLTCAGLSDLSPEDARNVLGLVERALVPGGRFLAEFAELASADTTDHRTWQFIHAEQSLFLDGSHLQLDERLYDAETKAEVGRTYVVPSDHSVRAFTRCRQYYTEDDVRNMLRAGGLEPVRVGPGSAPGLKKIVARKA